MLDSIEKNLESWDWKGQTIGSNEEGLPVVQVSSLIGRIERGFYLTKEVEIDLNVIDLSNYSFETNDLFDFMTHYKITDNADLSYPVIVNRRGYIIDGRHRLCKAIIKGKKKLKGIMVLDSDIL